MLEPMIKVATGSDEAPIINVQVLAFSADPVVRWMWQDPQQYLQHFPAFVSAFGGHAFKHDSAYYVEGYGGAALWLPPDVFPDEKALIAIIQSTVSESIQGDVFAIFEAMGSYHPRTPHWYLPLIGVDPLYQGSGYGSALMAHALILCDRHKIRAYLESTNPKNIGLYERYGFNVLGTIQKGTSPPIYPMLREPR